MMMTMLGRAALSALSPAHPASAVPPRSCRNERRSSGELSMESSIAESGAERQRYFTEIRDLDAPVPSWPVCLVHAPRWETQSVRGPCRLGL